MYTCSLQVSYSFLTGATAGCGGFCCCCAAAEDCSFSFFKAASLSALSLAICSFTLSLINDQHPLPIIECYSTLHVFLLIFLSSFLQLTSLLLSMPYYKMVLVMMTELIVSYQQTQFIHAIQIPEGV